VFWLTTRLYEMGLPERSSNRSYDKNNKFKTKGSWNRQNQKGGQKQFRPPTEKEERYKRREKAIVGSYKKILRKECKGNPNLPTKSNIFAPCSEHESSERRKGSPEKMLIDGPPCTTENVIATSLWSVRSDEDEQNVTTPTQNIEDKKPLIKTDKFSKKRDWKNREPSDGGEAKEHGIESFSDMLDDKPQRRHKLSKYQNAKREFQRKVSEKERKKAERLERDKAIKEANIRRQENREKREKIMKQKTKRGQPLMKGRIQLLLDKIQGSV